MKSIFSSLSFRCSAFEEPLVPVGSTPTEATKSLFDALSSYKANAAAFSAFEKFLSLSSFAVERSPFMKVGHSRSALRLVPIFFLFVFIALLHRPLLAQAAGAWVNISRAFIGENKLSNVFVSAPSDPNRLYMSYGTSPKWALARSDDGGLSWKVLHSCTASSVSNDACYVAGHIVMDPFNSDVLYFRGLRTLWKSVDGGVTLKKIFEGKEGANEYVNALTVDSQNPSVLYLGTNYLSEAVVVGSGAKQVNSIYKSVDGGMNWIPSDSGIERNIFKVTFIDGFLIDSRDSNVIYATAQDRDGLLRYNAKLYKSTNGGTSWRRITFPQGIYENAFILLKQALSDLRIFYATSIDERGGGYFLKSDDGAGEVWSFTTNRIAINQGFAVDPANSKTIYLGAPSGVYRSLNGGVNWSLLSNGLPVQNNLRYSEILGFSGDGKSLYARSGDLPDTFSYRSIFRMQLDRLEVIDPACSDVATCNGEYLEPVSSVANTPEMRLTSDLGKLVSANVKRSGAVADGVTTLLLRMRSDSSVTFSIRNPNGDRVTSDFWGTLTSRTDSSGGSSSLSNIVPEDTSQGKFVFAVYRVPKHLSRLRDTSNEITIEASISSSNNTEIQSTKIALRPPPVLIIHGLWSDSSKFQGLANYLRPKGYDVFLFDHDSGSFNPRQPFNLTLDIVDDAVRGRQEDVIKDGALTTLRRSNYAVTQVDVVAHSLGGLLARARSVSFGYKRKDNYFRGDFHKIIAIGTLNDGSKFVDFVLENRCKKVPYVTNDGRLIFVALEEVISYNIGPFNPAFTDLQTASAARKNIGRTTVPSHAIATIAPAFSPVKVGLTLALQWLNPFSSYDDIFINETGTEPEKHDLIVQLSSQLGRINSDHTTVKMDIIHFYNPLGFASQPTSEEVWESIDRLLSTPSAQNEFGEFPQPLSYGAPKSCISNIASEAERNTSAPTLVGAQPPSIKLTIDAGQTVRPGQTFSVTLSVVGGSVNGGVINILGEPYIFAGNGPINRSYTVPKNFIGRIKIVALAYGSQNLYAETVVNVQPSSPLKNIRSFPGRFLLDEIRLIPLSITGELEDGSQVNLTPSGAGTTYSVQSGRNAVVSVSPGGLVEVLGAGQDSIVIANSGKTLTIPVTVRLDIPRPTISSITPNAVNAESGPLDIVISGKDFRSDSLVYLNGEARFPRFLSSSQLAIQISSEDIKQIYSENITEPLDLRVTVLNPKPGGGPAMTTLRVIPARSISPRPKIGPRGDGRPISIP